MGQPDLDVQDEECAESSVKQKRTRALVQWWHQEKDRIAQGEARKFLHENKEKLEKSLSSFYQNDLIYRATNIFLSFIGKLAGIIDRTKDLIVGLVLKVPAPEGLKDFLLSIFNAVKLSGIVDFFRAKMYSLKKAPHNIKAIQVVEEVVTKAKREGLDVTKHFPDMARKFNERRLQVLQHSFFKEFSKSKIERILAMPFTFNRSISPVLPDTALWHKFFKFLENRYISDLILVGSSGERISTKHDTKHVVGASEAVRKLYQASVLKASGKRIFIVGNHEGYIGPYLVRSIMRRLGFENLTGNCNTVVGPRMFSNMVLKNGASNVGNLFLTLPSQKTTEVKEKRLAQELMKTGRRSQYLIKMPDAGLKLIEQMAYNDFMNKFIRSDNTVFSQIIAQLKQVDKSEAAEYLESARDKGALDELSREDYELFKTIMHEPFLIFPEGSRSYVAKDGSVTMKYVSPRFVQAYLRPEDVVLPISLVGGSDIGNSWRLKPANIGLCVGEPILVDADMIENYDTAEVGIMRKVAALPNIKDVIFSEQVQAGKKLDSQAA